MPNCTCHVSIRIAEQKDLALHTIILQQLASDQAQPAMRTDHEESFFLPSCLPHCLETQDGKAADLERALSGAGLACAAKFNVFDSMA